MVEYRGRVPARSVVIPGSVEKRFPAGTFHVPAALALSLVAQRAVAPDILEIDKVRTAQKQAHVL